MRHIMREMVGVAVAAALVAFLVFSRLHALRRGVTVADKSQPSSFWTYFNWLDNDARDRSSWPGPFFADGRPMFALRRAGGQPALLSSTLQSGTAGDSVLVVSVASCR